MQNIYKTKKKKKEKKAKAKKILQKNIRIKNKIISTYYIHTKIYIAVLCIYKWQNKYNPKVILSTSSGISFRNI